MSGRLAGAKSRLRRRAGAALTLVSRGTARHQRVAARAAHQLAVLVVRAVFEGDDACVGTRLRLDANGALSLETATDLFERLAGKQIDLCEQPVGRSDFAGMKESLAKDANAIKANLVMLPVGSGASAIWR